MQKATRYLHCSRCRADHPACLFSRIQRQCPHGVRYCIGQEGYLQICEHKTLFWLQIMDHSKSIMHQKFGHRYRTITCRDSSHTPDSKNLHHRKCYSTLTIGYKDTKDFYLTLSWGPNLSSDRDNEDNGPLTLQTLENTRGLEPLVQTQPDSVSGGMNTSSRQCCSSNNAEKEPEKRPEKPPDGWEFDISEPSAPLTGKTAPRKSTHGPGKQATTRAPRPALSTSLGWTFWTRIRINSPTTRMG